MGVVLIGPYSAGTLVSVANNGTAWTLVAPAARAKLIVAKPLNVAHTMTLAHEVVHITPDATNAVASPPAGSTGELYALVNELKLDGNAHFLDATVHDAADTVNEIESDDADSVPKAVTLVNEEFADFVAHCIQAGVHFTNDVFTDLDGTLATDEATAKTLANLLKIFYEAHRILTADAWEAVAAGYGFEWPCAQPFYVKLSTSGSVSIRTHS
jgi:hypothetical protein